MFDATRANLYPNEVSATAEDGSKSSLSRSDEGIPALLDTDTLLNIFPPSVFQPILKSFPGDKPLNKYSLYIVDCSLRDVNASIDLAFGKTTIKMPYSNFILSIEKPDECVLGMKESQSECDVYFSRPWRARRLYTSRTHSPRPSVYARRLHSHGSRQLGGLSGQRCELRFRTGSYRQGRFRYIFSHREVPSPPSWNRIFCRGKSLA